MLDTALNFNNRIPIKLLSPGHALVQLTTHSEAQLPFFARRAAFSACGSTEGTPLGSLNRKPIIASISKC